MFKRIYQNFVQDIKMIRDWYFQPGLIRVFTLILFAFTIAVAVGVFQLIIPMLQSVYRLTGIFVIIFFGPWFVLIPVYSVKYALKLPIKAWNKMEQRAASLASKCAFSVLYVILGYCFMGLLAAVYVYIIWVGPSR